ncbi:MAG: GntR family transcriptional regulator [Deltaproteobacteria bacterium]|nr:GntR family transcriptional regulator [Deltaproteobacteria bacterium]
MIVTGEFSHDKPLVERIISQKLGMSRTPVKHALSRLQQEGLIRIVPRQGVFPIKISYVEYQNILTIREVLEGLAARLAVDHVSNVKLRELRNIFDKLGDVRNVEEVNHESYALANVAFHREILQLSGNPKLIETVEGLYDHISLVRLRTIERTSRRIRSVEEHEAVTEALERRDPDEAEKAMRAHIRALKKDIDNRNKRDIDFFQIEHKK